MTEFQPGVPWKGIQSSGDPESDPYMTPGSVLGSPGPPTLNDSDHQLLRDNIGIWLNVLIILLCIVVCFSSQDLIIIFPDIYKYHMQISKIIKFVEVIHEFKVLWFPSKTKA